MYSLDCSYYAEEFNSISDLVDHVMVSGMDPNYDITRNGKSIGERLTNYIPF
jgi:hypothetical protein